MSAATNSCARAGLRAEPDRVPEVLSRSILVDGLDLVLDLARSQGCYLVDARDGRRYLDMFTFVASSALGMNHPALAPSSAKVARPLATSSRTRIRSMSSSVSPMGGDYRSDGSA